MKTLCITAQGLVYVSGLVLGLISMILALLGVAVLITYSPQNGFILLLMAFLISPMGLPLAAIWLLGKVQDFGEYRRAADEGDPLSGQAGG